VWAVNRGQAQAMGGTQAASVPVPSPTAALLNTPFM